MKREKVTRDALTEMQPGEVRVFNVPEVRDCYSGAVQAYQTGRLLNRKYKVSSDYDKRALTITREL